MSLPLHGPTPLALAGLASFAIGFAMVRPERGAPAVEPPQTAALRVVAELVAEKVDDSPAASQKRIESVFKLGAQQPGHIRDAALYAALLTLDAADFLAAAADFPALLARVGKGGWDSAKEVAFVEAWMDRWLAVDAPGALRFLGSSPLLAKLPAGEGQDSRFKQWSTMQAAAIRALARREPRWTHDWLAAQPAGTKRDSAAYALLAQVARQDPAQARKFLASFSGGVNRVAAVTGFVTGLAAADARAGFDAAWAEPAGPLRGQLLDIAMSEAGKQGGATVRGLLDRIDRAAPRSQSGIRVFSVYVRIPPTIRCLGLRRCHSARARRKIVRLAPACKLPVGE